MNRHSGIDLGKPASRKPIAADRLVGLLQDVAVTLYPEEKRSPRQARNLRVRYYALIDATRKFGRFLKQSDITAVSIDEVLLRNFSRSLSNDGTSDVQRRIYCSAIHKLINRLPRLYLQRELLTLAQAKRENRFDRFTDDTRESFNHFLRFGRKLRRGSNHLSPVLSADLLSDNLRKQIIDSALTFMTAVGSNDIFTVTEDDVEEYVEYHDQNGNKSTAHKNLDFIKPLFSNLRCRGLLENDVLRLIPRRVSGVNLDYVIQAAIDRLADRSTLDMDDFVAVRGRVLSFVLDYAYALRNRESSLVRCSDFHGVELRLPRSIQKVQKDTLPIYSYFPEVTGPFLKRYLELRAMKQPETDVLMVTLDGKPLGADGCRRAVKQHCDRLGLRTHEGNPVNPHRLRHSFGSLNIDPLGLGLSIVEIKDQLRHSSIQMTYDVYIAKNPLHKRSGYEKRMEKINGGIASTVVGKHAPAPIPSPVLDRLIEETQALRQLLPLGVNHRSLRKYALEQGKAEQNGRGVLYSSAFIADLATNHLTRAEAMDLLSMTHSTFFYWVKKDAIEFIQIGKVSLFRKDVVLEKRRAG